MQKFCELIFEREGRGLYWREIRDSKFVHYVYIYIVIIIHKPMGLFWGAVRQGTLASLLDILSISSFISVFVYIFLEDKRDLAALKAAEKHGKKLNNRMSVFFIGQDGVGKTSLKKNLVKILTLSNKVLLASTSMLLKLSKIIWQALGRLHKIRIPLQTKKILIAQLLKLLRAV